jgi:hypothetical protein
MHGSGAGAREDGGETTEISNPFADVHNRAGDPPKNDSRTIPVPPLTSAARFANIAACCFFPHAHFLRQPTIRRDPTTNVKVEITRASLLRYLIIWS